MSLEEYNDSSSLVCSTSGSEDKRVTGASSLDRKDLPSSDFEQSNGTEKSYLPAEILRNSSFSRVLPYRDVLFSLGLISFFYLFLRIFRKMFRVFFSFYKK